MFAVPAALPRSAGSTTIRSIAGRRFISRAGGTKRAVSQPAGRVQANIQLTNEPSSPSHPIAQTPQASEGVTSEPLERARAMSRSDWGADGGAAAAEGPDEVATTFGSAAQRPPRGRRDDEGPPKRLGQASRGPRVDGAAAAANCLQLEAGEKMGQRLAGGPRPVHQATSSGAAGPQVVAGPPPLPVGPKRRPKRPRAAGEARGQPARKWQDNEQHQSQLRPASAMASFSEKGTGSGSGSGNNDDNRLERRPNQRRSSGDQQAGARSVSSERPTTATTGGPGQRTKTTRVRINSTSEQIQDPNWLVQMSREIEAKQQKRSHLKSLQQKLKSTIVGASNASSLSPSSSAASASPAPKSTSGPTCGSAGEAPPVPATPLKAPVSILKQPSPQSTPGGTRRASPSVGQAQGQGSGQPASKQPQASSRQTQGSRQAQDNGGPSSSNHNHSGSNNGKLARPQAPEPAPGSPGSGRPEPASKPTPICADGQVKVSGWKRNNLLAKTLSHFDEIRGNQRPIFMPTKITLPPEACAAGPSSPLVQSAPGGGPPPTGNASPRASKFAEIVREAITKKGLLGQQGPPAVAAAAGKRHSDADQRQAVGVEQTGSPAKRPVSVDSTSGWLSSAPTAHSADHPQASAKSRSSSASGGRQQVGSRKAPAQAMSGQNPSSQRNEPFMAHLLAGGGDSSSSPRSLKLQLKNEQVLQNLRRQSNELAAAQHCEQMNDLLAGSSPTTGAGSGGSASSSRPGSVHLKDWKRLTTKLGLLTARSHSPSRPSQQVSIVRSAAGTPPQGAGGGANNMALRLTLSNQEAVRRAGDHWAGGDKKRGSASSIQQTVNLLTPRMATLMPSGERKLSSSSMVVQPVSGPPSSIARTANLPTGASRSAAASPMLFSSSQAREISAGPQVAGASGARRSSDSEAYRAPSSGALAGPSSASPSAETSDELDRRPVVVHRDDLLQLLQVRAGSPSSSQASGLAGGEPAPSTAESRSASLDCAGEQVAQALVQHRELKRRSSAESSGLAASELRIELEEASTESEAGGEVGENDRTGRRDAQPADRQTEHLSWVVKRTSKVAFYQKKLRKVRWNSRQRKQEAEAWDKSAERASAAGGEPPAGPEAATEAREGPLVMDPALIGDAIEIFLRTTMQSQQRAEDKSELAAASCSTPTSALAAAADSPLGDQQPAAITTTTKGRPDNGAKVGEGIVGANLIGKRQQAASS